MAGDPQDVLFFCGHCGSGARLEVDGLEIVESTALLPAPGRRARVWKPAWILEAEVAVEERVRADGRSSDGWRAERRFIIPAFPLPLPDLVHLARALSTAPGPPGEVPREPIRGGTLSLEDAFTLVRHLVVGDEVRRPDLLASVQVHLEGKAHRLAATPFDEENGRLRCAVTGVVVRGAE
jgi:hypothetical protein